MPGKGFTEKNRYAPPDRAQGTVIRTFKGIGIDCIGFNYIVGRKNIIIHYHHNAPVPRQGTGRQHYGIVQIHRAVCTQAGSRTHCPRKHNRQVMRNREMKKIGGLFHGVGSVGNHNTVAMLVRRENETLNALLKRLDKAIGKFYDNDEIVDEINGD